MLNFSEKIADVLIALTPSQKTVANYMLEHRNAVAFITLDEIAIKIGVSTTTVIRFARMLGYSGYADMQKDIRNTIVDKVSLPERLIQSRQTTSKDQLLSDTMKNDIFHR